MTKRDAHLPRCMYYNHGAYYIVVKNKWIKLSRNINEAFAMYSTMMNPITGKISTMGMVIDKYIAEILPTKKEKSRRDNLGQIKFLRAAFGDMIPSDITPVDVYSYMDARKAKVSANREKALLSHMFNYAIRWGVCSLNPCANVKNFQEKPRVRLVTKEEIEAIKSISPPMIQVIIDIACMTGIRQGDILKLKKSDLKEDGIEVTASKTGKKSIIMYNPKLLDILERARNISTYTIFLVSNRGGKQYSGDGFRTMWQRLLRKAQDEGLIKSKFTFHDLRAYAITNAYDSSGIDTATNIAGHSSSTLTKKVYIRGTQKIHLPG